MGQEVCLPQGKPKCSGIAIKANQFLTRGETLGLLHIEDGIVGSDSDSDTHRTSRANLERLAIAVGERMSLGLANLKLCAILRDQSIRDSLAGLFHRRHME